MHSGTKSKVVTISLSPQAGAYTREVIIPAIPVGGKAVVTNDWCIISFCYKVNICTCNVMPVKAK